MKHRGSSFGRLRLHESKKDSEYALIATTPSNVSTKLIPCNAIRIMKKIFFLKKTKKNY